LVQHTKTGKYTKQPQNVSNDNLMYQIAVKYTKLPKNMPTPFITRPPKLTKIGIFGLKKCHQAALGRMAHKDPILQSGITTSFNTYVQHCNFCI
jgi:hypothetical protein